jgi:hypothetical protein
VSSARARERAREREKAHESDEAVFGARALFVLFVSLRERVRRVRVRVVDVRMARMVCVIVLWDEEEGASFREGEQEKKRARAPSRRLFSPLRST